MGKKNFKKKEKKEGHVRVVLHGLAMEGKKKHQRNKIEKISENPKSKLINFSPYKIKRVFGRGV